MPTTTPTHASVPVDSTAGTARKVACTRDREGSGVRNGAGCALERSWGRGGGGACAVPVSAVSTTESSQPASSQLLVRLLIILSLSPEIPLGSLLQGALCSI